jgi:ABC-type phosphonate transport system ATPase subunit
MISFSNINKQYGEQSLFVDASFQLNPGEKVGLVGSQWGGQDNAIVGLCANGVRLGGKYETDG